MLILALDTATDVATSALVWDGEVLGELSSRPLTVLEDLDALLRRGGVRHSQVEGVAAGIGPGSFTGLRMGLAAARALCFAWDVELAGVSTLAALAAGAPDAVPVIDARRGEVFAFVDGGPAVGSELHLPRARFHAALASDFGAPDRVEPMYLRVPDVDRAQP